MNNSEKVVSLTLDEIEAVTAGSTEPIWFWPPGWPVIEPWPIPRPIEL